jgi:hypothetical protein
VNHRGAFDRLWTKLTDSKPGLKKPARYPPAAAPTVLMVAEPPADDAVLVVDLKANRVTYRGHEIPTRPPNNLQRQPLLALAVLALRPGEAVSMVELAEGMLKLGALRKRPTAPDARDFRYRMLRPFKKALAACPVEGAEIEGIIESVSGRLRLTVVGPLVILESRDAAA